MPHPKNLRPVRMLQQPDQQAKETARTERFTFKSEEVEKAKQVSVPKNTQKSTKWALGMDRMELCKANAVYSKWPVSLIIAEGSALDSWLCKFVLEVRKVNGDSYQPNTPHQMCSGIQR